MDTVNECAEAIGAWFSDWSWFPDFAQSPGFAGVLAVAAAIIAYLASTRNAKKERWWKRAEYALNLTLSADETVQVAGLEMLDSLKSRNRREQAFIAALANHFLDPVGDGTATPDAAATEPVAGEPSTRQKDEAYVEQVLARVETGEYEAKPEGFISKVGRGFRRLVSRFRRD